MFEQVSALLAGREPQALYHAALEVRLLDTRFAIEVAPVPDRVSARRGVVSEGTVGSPLARGLRVFRYEVRCWAGGEIPDLAWAVASFRLSRDYRAARRLLELAPSVPTPTWGRDELGAGEMWTSNSVVAWLLAASGLDAAAWGPPTGGRAPGWQAGLSVAGRRRQREERGEASASTIASES